MRKATRVLNRPDWNGKAVRHMLDANGDHLATMIWSHHSHEFQCHWHAQDQWGEYVRTWQDLIKQSQPEGWFAWPSTEVKS